MSNKANSKARGKYTEIRERIDKAIAKKRKEREAKGLRPLRKTGRDFRSKIAKERDSKLSLK